MGLIHDAVNYALAQQGKPYHAYGARFGPDWFDCSGLINACLNHTGTACSATNTVGFYNWGKQTGTLIPLDQGIRTYGALLIKGRWYGYGPLGHIAISLGDGNCMAAVGSRYGCRITSSYANGFQDGMIVPGADYGPPPPPPPPPAPPQPTFHLEPTMVIQKYNYPNGKKTIIPTKNAEGKYIVPRIVVAQDGACVECRAGAALVGADDPTQQVRRFIPPDLGAAKVVAVEAWDPDDFTSPPGVFIQYSDGRGHPVRFA